MRNHPNPAFPPYNVKTLHIRGVRTTEDTTPVLAKTIGLSPLYAGAIPKDKDDDRHHDDGQADGQWRSSGRAC